MPQTSLIPSLPIPETYAELRRGVEQTMLAGQRRIDEAKVLTYWETGRLIRGHLLLNAGRAAYGAQVIPRLARDLKIIERTLYHCVQFYEYFPILSTCSELVWGHYRLLCQVEDPVQRTALLKETVKRRWKCLDLEIRVRSANAVRVGEAANGNGSTGGMALVPAARPLLPKRGTPGLHLVVDRGGGPAVDLGFKLYRPLTAEQARRYAKGEIVRLGEDGSVRHVDEATKADLFTYGTVVRRVVDGDTIVIAIEVTPGVWLEEKLRLRGLDCPEMTSPEGKAAKRFVDALLAPGTAVTICSTKPDKYDRYLADVFVGAGAGNDLFLNQALLENGHAVRKDAWEFTDWDSNLVAGRVR